MTVRFKTMKNVQHIKINYFLNLTILENSQINKSLSLSKRIINSFISIIAVILLTSWTSQVSIKPHLLFTINFICDFRNHSHLLTVVDNFWYIIWRKSIFTQVDVWSCPIRQIKNHSLTCVFWPLIVMTKVSCISNNIIIRLVAVILIIILVIVTFYNV